MRWVLGIVLIALLGCHERKLLVPVAQCERPQPEVCNGRDDDCDGSIDEAVVEACSNPCESGVRLCVGGVFQPCSARLPRGEVCNGRDDDCDGVVDNPEALAVEFCYEGVSSELAYANSPCRPGLLRCEEGRKVCRDSVRPAAELCNGIDDNCNGKVDDGVEVPSDVDLVFVIDNSGSMATVISTVRAVVTGFRTKYGARADLRWALVAAPDRDWTKGATPTLQVDFTNPTAFSAAVGQQDVSGSATEATVDAIDMLISPSNPLALSWKPGAKKSIVIFSDEEPQSHTTAETYQSISAKVLNSPGVPLAEVVVFADMSHLAGMLMWRSVVGPGKIYNIHSSQFDMNAQLEKIIVANSCTP